MLRSSLLLIVALCALVPVRSQSNVDPAFFNGLRYGSLVQRAADASRP